MRFLTGAILKAHTYLLTLLYGAKQSLLVAFFLAAALLFTLNTSAQSPSDTLNFAKKLKGEGKLKAAASLLKTYHKAHPTELNSTWVYAQTEYWLKKFNKAKGLYKRAIKDHPTNYYLKLDFANFLIATGKAQKAKPVLTGYYAFDSTSSGFKSAIAPMFWQDKHRKPGDIIYRNYLPTAADTLNKVKQLKDNKAPKAYRLLKRYYKNHSADFNTTWLYAQVAYLNKHFKKSKKLYKKAIAEQAGNYYLKLDYANTLVNIADYNEALPLLNTYHSYDSTNIKLHLNLARIYLAQGNYPLAQKEIEAVFKQDATNADAKALSEQLQQAPASYVKIKGNYNIDSQPLQTITPAVEAGIYLHPEATLKLNLQTPLFIGNGSLQNAQWLQVGDVSSFKKAGFQLSFDAGIVKQPFENKISWTANLELKKILLKHLELQAQAGRKPYYYTLSSLDTIIMVTRVSAYAGWNDLSTVNGRLFFEYNGFAGKNYILGGGGWVFTPPLKVSVFEFRIGYAYSFSTSKDNKFTPEKTLTQILTNYDPTAGITGIYDPYFTPDNMSIHSALASVLIHPVKVLDIGFNANVGFYATALTPYFFLDKNQGGETFINEGYATEKFYPMEFSVYGLWHITKKINLKADYTYRKTYFYTSTSVGLGLTINFWNDKKGQ